MIPEQLTVKEVEFMIDYFQLHPGSKVLDLMCGYGRHAIALAERGVNVTAIDNLQVYIDEIREITLSRKLPITYSLADVARYQPTDLYDLTICMGNSLNFFDEVNTQQILFNISKQLKPGGHLLIHSWSVTEIAAKTFKSEGRGLIGEIQMETNTEFLFRPTRMEAQTKMTSPKGKVEIKKAIDYVFSIAEYDRMFSNAGIAMTKMYGIPGKKEFTIGDPRIYIIAKKI